MLSTEKKRELVHQFGGKPQNTGVPEVQVAILTNRINELNAHVQTHKQDKHSMRGLLKLVGQRKRLLTYLKSRDVNRYAQLIRSLELRK